MNICAPLCLRQAIRVSVNPLYFMIPATVGCSYAFMLPVSTPPNSIAFASGHLMVKDMVTCTPALGRGPPVRLVPVLASPLLSAPQVKTGVVMNVLGILCVSLAINTWGVAMFNLTDNPDWAQTIKTTHVPAMHTPLQALNATF